VPTRETEGQRERGERGTTCIDVVDGKAIVVNRRAALHVHKLAVNERQVLLGSEVKLHEVPLARGTCAWGGGGVSFGVVSVCKTLCAKKRVGGQQVGGGGEGGGGGGGGGGSGGGER
jgi:hypothetical protein